MIVYHSSNVESRRFLRYKPIRTPSFPTLLTQSWNTPTPIFLSLVQTYTANICPVKWNGYLCNAHKVIGLTQWSSFNGVFYVSFGPESARFDRTNYLNMRMKLTSGFSKWKRTLLYHTKQAGYFEAEVRFVYPLYNWWDGGWQRVTLSASFLSAFNKRIKLNTNIEITFTKNGVMAQNGEGEKYGSWGVFFIGITFSQWGNVIIRRNVNCSCNMS